MRTTITLSGREHPCFRLEGSNPGPRVSIVGGVHGCEYSSIAAVTRVMRELETREIAGTVTGVPIVSLESFEQRSPFVVPADGKNLNRSFPGDPDGTYTDRLAHDIYTNLIEPADALIDLHGGDLVEALEPFALYCDPGSRELALAFGLPFVVDSTEGGALGGMSASAAPGQAVIAEAGGAGQLEERATALLADGTLNALRHLGVIDGRPDPPRSRTVKRFEWLYSGAAGFWVASVSAGDEVPAGATLGEVRDLYGETVETIVAPDDGVVLFLTTSAAVGERGLLLGLGCER